jgi:hypothetical protein
VIWRNGKVFLQWKFHGRSHKADYCFTKGCGIEWFTKHVLSEVKKWKTTMKKLLMWLFLASRGLPFRATAHNLEVWTMTSYCILWIFLIFQYVQVSNICKLLSDLSSWKMWVTVAGKDE